MLNGNFICQSILLTLMLSVSSNVFCKDNFVELGEVIKLFMVEKTDYARWDIGAGDTDLPIKWLTNGVDTEVNGLGEAIYVREAISPIKVNNEKVKILKKRLEAVPWNISLYSRWEKAPEEVLFAPETFFEYDVEKVLKTSSIGYKKICSSHNSDGGYSSLYFVSFSNKEGFLIESYTCGSAGCSTLLSLIYNQEDNDEVKEICSTRKP